MLIALVVSANLAIGGTVQGEHFFTGLGNHHRAITTQSASAQKYFDQGMAFMYGFNHGAAIKSFKAATQEDPNCAMAYWGIAIANGPNINLPMVPPPAAVEAWNAVTKAKALEDKASPVEKALIEAQATRYANPQPQDRSPLDKAYSDAMRGVWHQFPKDTDVGALFAESLMDLRPWDLWSLDFKPRDITPEVEQTLEAVIKLDPMHPQANHLYIHCEEAGPHPEKALQAANKLRTMEPALGHMVHMPSHIDIRVGHWKEAEIANEKAIAADAAYRKANADPGFYRGYILHNYHMLSLAEMMRGEGAKAIKTMDDGVATVPAQWAKDFAFVVDGFMCMPIEVRKRFGKWDEVLAYPDFPDYFPISRAMRHADRAVAFAAKGNTTEAQSELEAFEAMKKALPAEATFGNNPGSALLDVAEHLAMGEVAFAEKKNDEAIDHLKMAVAAEDQLHYDEPPDWIQPTRHTLGAVLVQAGKYQEAIPVYQEDLARHPNNGWALKGLALAYKGLGDAKNSNLYAAKFKQAWQSADLSIGSSCLCVNGMK